MGNNSRRPEGEGASVRPYSGVLALDLTAWLGGYASRLFADLGARVIRVEANPSASDRKADDPASRARFTFLNASKEVLSLDFADGDDRATFWSLARRADLIFVERGGPIADRIAELRAANARAVITVISPYGLGGPMCDAPASDLVLQASGGIAWMSGQIDKPPLSLPEGQVSMVTSVYAATVSAIAFVDAESSGRGHLIDVSAQECIAHSLQNAIQVWDLEGRVSMRGGEGTRDATEDVFPCSDGYVFVASPLSLGPSWPSLVAWVRETGHPAVEELSKPRWSDRKWRLTSEARTAFRAAFTDFAQGLSKDDMAREAIARRIVLAPVSRIGDLIGDAQLMHRGFFTSLGPDPEPNFPGAPYRFSREVWSASHPFAFVAVDEVVAT